LIEKLREEKRKFYYGNAHEFVLPYASELAEIARKYNIPVMFHSDGNVSELLDHLIKIGVCAVNPMQPHLNDAGQFKEKYGDKLAVYGGLDNCYIIPDGTPEDVREHVSEVFNILGKSDGALIFSTHDIPEYTPKENIEALISTIKNECNYQPITSHFARRMTGHLLY